jgi:drug/metabolite transporter (DMT)-like permease
VYASLVLQVLGYATWMIVISKEKLGVAVAIMGSFFYVAIALIGWLAFDESLTRLQWAGVLLITVGIACMMA